jgi:hypothetical protein
VIVRCAIIRQPGSSASRRCARIESKSQAVDLDAIGTDRLNRADHFGCFSPRAINRESDRAVARVQCDSNFGEALRMFRALLSLDDRDMPVRANAISYKSEGRHTLAG